jgi:hypothetical protein
MASHININYEYSKQELADLFAGLSKTQATNSTRLMADLGENSFDLESLSPFFTKFNFIPKNDLSVELAEFVNITKPHINPGNNGLLIFPVSGSMTLNTYSYMTTTVDDNGRPTMDFLNMSEEEIDVIEGTKTGSVVIDTPIAVDGLTTFSLEPTEVNTVVLVMKIDKNQSWESVVEILESM